MKITVLYVHYINPDIEHKGLSADLCLSYLKKIIIMSMQNTLMGRKITWYIQAYPHYDQ